MGLREAFRSDSARCVIRGYLLYFRELRVLVMVIYEVIAMDLKALVA